MRLAFASGLRKYTRPFSTFTKALTELAVERIGPIGAETKRLLGAPDEIDRILSDGSARARAIAEPILREVKQIVGFIRG